MPCCKSEEYYKWCKDLPVVDYKDGEGNEYCIFHAPQGKKGVSVEEFNKLVFEEIIKAKNAGKFCDLSGTVLEGDISFDEFNEDNPLPEILFYEAIFSGNAHFSRVVFSGNADFSETVFNGQVGFFGTTFSKAAFFQRAAFSKNAVFSKFIETTLTEETSFSKTMLTTFSERADFSGAIFSKEANFFEATFSKEADFLGAIFKDVYFTKATFSRETNFLGLSVDGKIRFEGINLKKVSFLDTDLRKIDLINFICPKTLIWRIKPRRDVLHDELTLFGNIKDEEEEDKNFFQRLKSRFKGSLSEILKQEWSGFKKDISCDKGKIKKVEILNRMLKQKYKEEHNEPEVSNWHYGEKEMYRKVKRLRRMIPFTLSNLYWFSSGYGEGPIRAGVVLLLLILTIAVLLGITGLIPSNQSLSYEVAGIKGWADIMDFRNLWSLILNTLQYATFEKEPDFVPKTIYGSYLKFAARILIPLQAALFALAVRNRFRR
ncbi:MAG: pentapeptide repeat-containing protein [Thermodesulfovibrionales bacterium]|nr:pentapeptide repeat-containing protein [Thermodesulfovibrionales bacterium]